MASEQMQGRKIAITGHGFDVTETDIRSLFDRFGEISEVVYIRNKDTGKSKGFSFVVYKDHTSAQRAINSMHHDFIFDRRVSVEFARQHKLDDLAPSNYSPGLAKPPQFHHPHGMNSENFRHIRRPQQNDFFHPRPPMESRYPFPPSYPPQVRSEMNPSPPNRFHTPTIRSEAISKEKSLEVIQEPETAQHPLATPSSLSGASEQEDGEIPSGPDKKFHEPLEDGEMLDGGTPTQKISETSDELPFRQRNQTQKPSQFSISNWKIDADTEKLLANIIRIQGSVKIDSNEAQRVWAQGGLRKESVSSPPTEFESRLHKSASDQLSPMRGGQDKHEREIPSPNITSSSRSTNWNHARSGEQPNTNEVRWEEKRPLGSTLQDAHLSKPIPMEAQHMLGHHSHESREWAPPGLSRHRPDLRHILGSDSHIGDQNPGNYGYNTYHFQRSIQDPPSRPPYSHPPPSHHGHFPIRHPGPDSQFQSFPQQQQVLPMRGHPSQQGYIPGPGHHPSPDLHQSAPPMMDQPYEMLHQHPPSDNYPYVPIHMQDHNSGSMPGYSVPFPGGNNSMSIEQNVGLHDHSVPQSLAPQHQQPMDGPGQLLGNDNNTNYQISPATIAQATIAQAAVNSDQCQDLSRSKDPMTLMSRMYVGNLDPKQVTKEDLHDTFSVYGRILDIKIHNHFAFIQFDNPFSCMDAIHTAHANTIQGQQPKLQLAADGQRARNEMISNGNTSSLPPDPKELPPNMPYPNPFRGQSGHLPTFLTVQPAQQPPIEPPITPNFQSTTPIQMPVGISQPLVPQQAILQPQNPLSGPGLGPQSIQTPGNVLQPSQEAANAQINAQLLSTALGLDPSALATILSSLPMLAKAKEESSDVKAPQNPKLFSNSLDTGKLGSNKKDRSERESKKRKKKEGEKHAKAKRMNELEAKKQKAKKKEEELAKVRARLARDITGTKDTKLKERVKHKTESKQDSKLPKHFHSDEVYKKSIKHESSTAKDHSKHRVDSKSLVEPTSSREKEGKVHITKDKNLGERTEKPSSDKSNHKSRHESKSHKKSHSNNKSHKRSHYSDSPSSIRDSPTKQDDLMDQYAYLYDMMTRNPMNKLIKDYHDYYVGIYGYDFSHWSSEYERFLEDYPMEEDTKEMLELMQCFRGYPYYYGSMCGGNIGELETEHSSEIPCSPNSIQDQTKRMKISDDAKDQDASQAPK